jgi:hypothetical protein
LTWKELGKKYVLQWYLYFRELEERCGRNEPSAMGGLPSEGGLMFDATNQDCVPDYGIGECEVVPKDVAATSECPEFGAVVEIRPNATSAECPVVEKLLSREGNPCAVELDEAMISTISSQVSSLAAPTTTATSSSLSSAGFGPARTVQTALAAACLLCGLAL